MALNGSDNLAISRAGSLFKILGSDILAYVEANIGTSQFSVANIVARNALTNLSSGDRVYVTDATGDATVTAGWAIYLYVSSGVWTKVGESESMDVIAGSITNLTYTAGASSGIVVSSDGADATLPAVDGVNAGLALPAHKVKLDFLTVTALTDLDGIRGKAAFLAVTAATDLDLMRTRSHLAAPTSGAAANNPIVIDANQVLSFSIANLTLAP